MGFDDVDDSVIWTSYCHTYGDRAFDSSSLVNSVTVVVVQSRRGRSHKSTKAAKRVAKCCIGLNGARPCV